MTFEQDFKDALSNLPAKEKDKLIIRLLRQNIPLAKKLYFELVDSDTVEDKRKEMLLTIEQKMVSFSKGFYSPGYLLVDTRYLSGEITEHVKTTKDPYGDISLNLYMVKRLLELNNKSLVSAGSSKCHTINIYLVAKMFKLLLLIQKQHEDLHIEFSKDLETIGALFEQNPYLMKTAIYNGLDINWLVTLNLPKNLPDIHKNLKSRGFLK